MTATLAAWGRPVRSAGSSVPLCDHGGRPPAKKTASKERGVQMAKKTRRRKARAKSKANHGKRPNA